MTTEIAKIVSEINRAFDEYKAKNDAHIAELAKGKDDVVAREQIARIDAAMTTAAKDIAALQAALTAAATAGNHGRAIRTVEATRHSDAFFAMVRRGVDAGLHDLAVRAALSTDSTTDGGFVVPVETDAAITRVLETVSAMRRIATVRTIGSASLRTVHNVAGSGTGWVSETEARPETTTPRFVESTYPAHELYAMPSATQSMLDDAFVNVEAWLAGEIAIKFAETEGAAFISGNGVARPRGILDYPKVANASFTYGKVGFVKTGASGAFPTVSTTVAGYDVMVDLYHALRSGYRNNASWIMNDTTLASVRKLKTAEGGYIYLPPTETEPGSIMGKPVETDDNMPSIAANSYSIAFGDFRRGYLVVERTGVRVLRDPFSAKGYVLFYTTKRVGGGIADYEAIKLLQFAS